jgi:hypothetical protein
MENIEIQPTATTPRISFRPLEGYFEISVKSLPENSYDFFQPLLEYVEAYAEKPVDATKLVFKLQYFNTSSTSHFLRMIKKFEKIHSAGKNVEVHWFYDEEDEDYDDCEDEQCCGNGCHYGVKPNGHKFHNVRGNDGKFVKKNW